MRCDRPDCGRGEIDAEGFCEVCDMPPLAGIESENVASTGETETVAGSRTAAVESASGQGAAAASGSGVVSDTVADLAPVRAAKVGVAQLRPDPWWGLALARTDLVVAAGPGGDAVADETRRWCASPACQSLVGQSSGGGAAGRLKGYCPDCGYPFDFTVPTTGQVIAGRYEVKRVLGAGGDGKSYLVHDRNLDADVVIKSLWRPKDETGKLESSALVALRHDSIVRILSYEPSEPYELNGPYLVLEYVPGTRLSARDDDPLDVILGHGLQILQALDYLHARGLLHCDVKPENVVRFGEPTADGLRDRVRLIDFGAVRALADPSPVTAFTEDYAPPWPVEEDLPPDPERLRPTRGFDLFCLGSTLQELCGRTVNDRLSDPGVDALRRLLARAVDARHPARRFRTARQFAEQLSGVIRQVVAAPGVGRLVTRASMLFGPMDNALHGGLGAPRPIGHWAAAHVSVPCVLHIAQPFACPTPAEAVAALPVPLEDPDDDPRDADRVRNALADCRDALRHGSSVTASRALASAGLPDWHWLHGWYTGLIALARQDHVAAAKAFGEVRDMLPGELIPLVALGLCAEMDRELVVARMYYETVVETAPALGAAGFGLARVYLRTGRRARAVEVADRLANTFRFKREASIGAIRLLVATPTEPDGSAPDPPDRGDLLRAEQRLDALTVDERDRALIQAEVSLARFQDDGDGMELSTVVKRTAGYAATEREFVAMVDLANRLRPPVDYAPAALVRRIRRNRPQ